MISMFHPTEYRVCGLPRNRGRPAYAYAYDRRLHFLEYASHFCEPARILRSGLRLTSIGSHACVRTHSGIASMHPAASSTNPHHAA